MQLPSLLPLLLPLLLPPLLLLPPPAAAAGSGSVGVYSVGKFLQNRRLTGCLLDGADGVNMTSICAASCHAAAGCQSFSFSQSAARCELHSATAAAGPCKLAAAAGWTHFNRTGFAMPQPPVGVCRSGNECLNKGVCLSRTEVSDNSLVCACKSGFAGDKCQDAVQRPQWATWSDFGPCSVTCGRGLQLRTRRCRSGTEDMEPWQCGADSPEQYRGCNTTVCPSWSPWSQWSPCSTASSCGQGVRQRSRSCLSGGVIGKDCLGSPMESTPCESVSCGIDSAPVSLLSDKFEPQVVGKGFVRIYNDLYAAEGYVCADGFDADKEGIVVCRTLGFDGVQAAAATPPEMPSTPKAVYFLTNLKCQGSETSLQMCQHAGWSNDTSCAAARAAYVVCKVHGRWSAWSEWSSCDGKCGSASRSRSRSCANPKPLGGGRDCPGAGSSESLCPSLPPCPVDGKWNEWSSWGHCSTTCGGGSRNRSRSCTQPQHGGRDCAGASWQSEACGTDPCPVDGYYKQWGSWSSCSATCGGGQQKRMRTCVPPAHNGKDCEGPSSQQQACNQHYCPIAGGWGSWSPWGSCNVTCGGGVSLRRRSCDNPAPKYNGADCAGSGSESKDCNSHNCPMDGYFGQWSAWSACSRTCGGGQRNRSRGCVPPRFGGRHCSGDSSETQSCMTQPCPIPGDWLQWQSWSRCSRTCDGGQRLRQRTCNLTSHGELTAPCLGDSEQTEACNVGTECRSVRSCQELKNKGLDYDLETIIDPDGKSGPIQPFKVKCRMNEMAWAITEVGTNMTLPGTYAQGQEAGGSIRIQIPYDNGVSAAALNGLARISLNCSQYLRYTCHDAGIHYQNNLHLQATYWVNYAWVPMVGWGQPYSMRTQSVCACHASAACGTMTTKVGGVDTVVQAPCNCDRNERKPNVYDDGTVYDKSNLPVNEVRVGDTGDDTEWSYTFVGPLRCWGLDPSAGRR